MKKEWENTTEERKSKKRKNIEPVKSYGDILEKCNKMRKSVPGTIVEDEKNWVVGKYGRPLPIVHMPKYTGKKPLKIDPSKYCHCLKKINIAEDGKSESLSNLTWSISSDFIQKTKSNKNLKEKNHKTLLNEEDKKVEKNHIESHAADKAIMKQMDNGNRNDCKILERENEKERGIKKRNIGVLYTISSDSDDSEICNKNPNDSDKTTKSARLSCGIIEQILQKTANNKKNNEINMIHTPNKSPNDQPKEACKIIECNHVVHNGTKYKIDDNRDCSNTEKKSNDSDNWNPFDFTIYDLKAFQKKPISSQNDFSLAECSLAEVYEESDDSDSISSSESTYRSILDSEMENSRSETADLDSELPSDNDDKTSEKFIVLEKKSKAVRNENQNQDFKNDIKFLLREQSNALLEKKHAASEALRKKSVDNRSKQLASKNELIKNALKSIDSVIQSENKIVFSDRDSEHEVANEEVELFPGKSDDNRKDDIMHGLVSFLMKS